MRRVEIATLGVGARVEEKGVAGGGGEGKKILAQPLDCVEMQHNRVKKILSPF